MARDYVPETPALIRGHATEAPDLLPFAKWVLLLPQRNPDGSLHCIPIGEWGRSKTGTTI